MFDFSLLFHCPFHVYITCPFLLVYSNNAILIAMFVFFNLCASMQGSWIVTDRRLLCECSALLAGHELIHSLRVLIWETRLYYFISACLVCLFLLQVYCGCARRACRTLCAFMANRCADYLLLLC